MPVKFFLKNTKIVSTFGPAITATLSLDDPENNSTELQNKVKKTIHDVIKEGVNCVRFNFSHGLVQESDTRIEMIRRVQRELLERQKTPRKYMRMVSLLADTKGPEIRVYKMDPAGVIYETGQEIVIDCIDKKQGTKDGFSVVDATGVYNMANDCVVGNFVLVEDGKLKLQIQKVDRQAGRVFVKVMNKHLVKANKRINLPGASYTMDFLSSKDIADIKYAVDNGFDLIALSFVNTPENVNQVRLLVADYCREKNIPNLFRIYSKSETTQCCENLDEIIEASDGIMIARGDLGLEVPYYEVPYWTKQMINKCRSSQKPVITATQMLDSLERNVVATRAEVSDVYRAAEMGSDCTMLSGETAQGQFPVLAVKTMSNIVFEAERHFNSSKFVAQFETSIFHNLDEAIKKEILKFKEALHNHPKVNVILMKADDASLPLLRAYSSLRLRPPLFVFKKSENIGEYFGAPQWNSQNYMKMKEMAETTLFRGINVIFVEGDYASADCATLFKECFQAFIMDCCPECCCKNMLCLDDPKGEWQLVAAA